MNSRCSVQRAACSVSPIVSPRRWQRIKLLRCTLHAARRTVLIGYVVLAACPSAAADHAKLGDQAVAKGDYTTAVAEYRAGVQASTRPELLAKLGSAAFHLKNYREAAEAYTRLGEIDPSRGGEAATGLERVAKAAQGALDAMAVREALIGLQRIAPDRPAGRIALSLALSGKLEPTEAIPLIPYAMAGARDDATVDSLLHLYAAAHRETTACEEAVRIYQTILRRAGTGDAPRPAVQGLAECAVRLGLDAEGLNQPEIAERWYQEAIRVDSPSELGRRALVGLGDARLAQGDSLQAARAYRAALGTGAEADSLGQLAEQRLRALGAFPTDSVTTLNREP